MEQSNAYFVSRPPYEKPEALYVGPCVHCDIWPAPSIRGTILPDQTKNIPQRSGNRAATPPSGIDPATGAALRSVYQKAVDETIPDEMLDLLSKLD